MLSLLRAWFQSLIGEIKSASGLVRKKIVQRIMTHELLNQPSNKYYLDYFQGFNCYKQYYNCYLCFGYMYNYSSRIH